ncbi:YceI family protein [Aestuariibius insulae]|uniref:YceI family protein n=1 Tax=Aestuariibius insulae TaxID=2058287 RepID=UPI00345EC544
MRHFAVMLSLLLTAPLYALGIVEEDSTLGFSVVVGTREVSGQFEDWSAKIDLEARQITVTVRTTSATTNDALLDSVLHSAAWLNSRTFPDASFTSTEITETSDGYLATGILAVRDTTLPLVVMISEPEANERPIYMVQATLDRTAVGMEAFADTVSQTAEITGKIAITP